MDHAALTSGQLSAYPGAVVFDHVSDAIVVVDHALRAIYANPAAHVLGEGVLGPEARELAEQARRQRAPAEASVAGWWRRATPMPGGGVVLIVRPEAGDVAAALRRAETRIRELFERAPTDMLVLQVREDGAVLIEEGNAAFCRTTGLVLADLRGCPIESALEPVTAGILAGNARISVEHGDFECQHNLQFPVGERLVRTYYRPMPDDGGGIRRVLLTQIDLTENRRIEIALRQALRLEVVGQLTGGVAHDFNNLLTAILGSLELMGRAPTDERQRRWIRVATEAAQRGATMTQQLLSYARKQFLAPTATDVPAAIGAMMELLRGSLGSRITLQTDFDAATWSAHTDIAQLELALMNLMVNARAAMPNGGRLLLSTRNVTRYMPDLPAELEPGSYVVLTVVDTGIGMEPDVLARAMEPFFTTKGVGEGSGLGLSQAYGFARQLGGTLRLTSQPGIGTKAEIFLPRAPSGGEQKLRLLLVDEDEAVRGVAAALLREEGWVLDEAAHVTTALDELARASYTLLLADLEMSGADLARRAIALQPSLRVLFLTAEPRPATTAGLPGPVIGKPFLAERLVQSVRAVLAGGPS